MVEENAFSVAAFMLNRNHGLQTDRRAPNYRVVAAWVAFLLFIGGGAFVLGMAVHNEALAKQQPPRPDPIYYCATGVATTLYEPCKEIKDQMNI